MTTRVEVEREILDDELFVERLARLLESGADLPAWPDDMTVALALALEDEAMSRTESWKAVTLCRHLFGPADMVPGRLSAARQPSAIDRRRAERLRSDLSGRVRYRAGVHLLRPAR
jgi:hypothetical protein